MNFAMILQIMGLLSKSGVLDKLIPVAGELISKINQPQQKLDVRWLQQSLNALLGLNLEQDNSYGSATREAVKQFQKKFMPGEAVDGWAGVKTTAAILQALEQRK